MERCRVCETSMTRNETVCINCGTPKFVKQEGMTTKAKIRLAIKIMTIGSAVISAVSLLTPWGPPFVRSAIVTAMLGLVKSSADEMLGDEQNH